MPKESLPDIAGLLQRLVLRSGRLLRRRLESARSINYKNPNKKDMVTEMDREIETLFIRAIRKAFPGHDILSEEAAAHHDLKQIPPATGYRWIIDPVDGTTNYAHRFPHFSVSAGVEKAGRVVLGAVYNPMLKELFFAERGRGAWRNGRRIRVSTTDRLEEALLATGFPYDIWTSKENNFADFYLMSMASQAVRRPGSASLDICDVACGRFDGFWEYSLKPWDVAAATLMVEEAGGEISTAGKPGVDLFGGAFLVSNGRIHKAIARVLRKARACKSFEDLKRIYTQGKRSNRSRPQGGKKDDSE